MLRSLPIPLMPDTPCEQHQAFPFPMPGPQLLPHNLVETEALQQVSRLLHIDPTPFLSVGLQPPRTLLLSGPPGVGKTKAVHIAAHQASIPIFPVRPPPNVSHSLNAVFRSARNASHFDPATQTVRPSIVFIDEIDAVCPSNAASTHHHPSNTSTNLLISIMDSPIVNTQWNRAHDQSIVFVIAASNRPNMIHPKLRTAGRFDREVLLSPPPASVRYDFLCAMEAETDTKILRDIANRATGFVAADLVALCNAARDTINANYASRETTRQSRALSADDFDKALRKTTPSVLRSAIASETPLCTWDEVGGLENVKKRLQMAVEWPLRHSATFKRLGLKAPRGILLHGPPGCSKTTLVRVVASQSHASFIRLNGADIYSCYLGEAERFLREAFALARAAAPCVLFLDEIDAVVGKRSLGGPQVDGNGVQERVLSTLLTEMDGIVSAEGVLVIGATNRVDLLDDALLRPGRFDDILEVGMPDTEARHQILKIHSARLPLGDDVDLSDIATQTAGWSGAELMSICVEAGLAAIREVFYREEGQNETGGSEEIPVVKRKHFHLSRPKV